MVVINGNLPHISRERHRQFPGGVILAKEHISDGMAGQLHPKELEIARNVPLDDLPDDPAQAVPMWFGMSWIYLAGALAGGGFFLYASAALCAAPSVPFAWRTFAASIVQLGLLLTAAILDRLILG